MKERTSPIFSPLSPLALLTHCTKQFFQVIISLTIAALAMASPAPNPQDAQEEMCRPKSICMKMKNRRIVEEAGEVRA